MDPVLQHSEDLFRGRFALVRERFHTRHGLVEKPVIHHPGAVAILAQPAPGRVVLVRQFRYPLKRWTLEIPAGTREPGEEAVVTADRELREETGLRAGHLVELERFHPAPGVSDEEMILFRATGLTNDPLPPDHGELIAREDVVLAEVPRLRREGLLTDAKTLLALGHAVPAT